MYKLKKNWNYYDWNFFQDEDDEDEEEEIDDDEEERLKVVSGDENWKIIIPGKFNFDKKLNTSNLL